MRWDCQIADAISATAINATRPTAICCEGGSARKAAGMWVKSKWNTCSAMTAIAASKTSQAKKLNIAIFLPYASEFQHGQDRRATKTRQPEAVNQSLSG
jgi:hypothetical protein